MPSIILFNELNQPVKFTSECYEFAGGLDCQPVNLSVIKNGILMKSSLKGFVTHKASQVDHHGLVAINNIIEFSPDNEKWFIAEQNVKVQGILILGSTYIILNRANMPIEIINNQLPTYY